MMFFKTQIGYGVQTLQPGIYHVFSGTFPPLYFCGDSDQYAGLVLNGTYAGQSGSWWQIQKGQVFTISCPLTVVQPQAGQYAQLEQLDGATITYPDICVVSSSRANPDGSYDLPLLLVGGLQQLSLTIENPATLIQTWQAWSVAPQGLAGYLSQPADPTLNNARITARGIMRW